MTKFLTDYEEMHRVKVKPVSVNHCYTGRVYKNEAYRSFEELMLYSLPKIKVPEGKLFLRLEFGVSSKKADVDNLVKCTLDCLCRQYGFNDNKVYLMEVAKEDVKRGEEYIDFDISVVE